MADLLLGGRIDPATGERTAAPSSVATSDLTTHGVIVGMTGSGKTGLGVVLIEECLSAGIPTILIDPKGDLTNLCLIFPDLLGADFRPWVNDSDARKAGLDLDAFAEQQATSWRDGLGGWGIAPERLAELRRTVDFTIYTPGSSAGTPLNIVGSLDAPPAGTDPEVMSDEIDGYVTSLLGMIGISGDPLSSREHILLANIIQNAWSQGQDLDLGILLAQVQQPPMRKLGFLELDAFFPPADRMAFALKINGLLASPSFAAWMQGAAIDIDAMLHTPDGRPRCAIVTTAHLDDAQRQSVTSLVLAKLVTWMRRQSGTSDLRALLYMDEVAGYLPPTANPPTKKPIMLLLKQARAFGLGVVLSTQNPVDVDYKALSNAGTWIIGRLQTEQDKNRLVDGLSSAAGGVDVNAVSDTIGNLGKRQFLLKRAGTDVPEVMTTRWAMSYLRGPLTRDQIGQAMAPPATAAAAEAPAPLAPPEAAPAVPAASSTAVPVAPSPAVPAAVPTASAPAVPAAVPTAVPAASAPAVPAAVPTASAPASEPAAGPVTAAPTGASSAPPVVGRSSLATAGADESPVMPSVPAGVPVAFVDPAAPWLASVGCVPGGQHLRAGAVARVQLRYDDVPAGYVHDEEYEAVLTTLPQVPASAVFTAVDYDDRDLVTAPPVGSVFGLLPAEVSKKPYWTALQKSLVDTLVRTRAEEIYANKALKAYSRAGETREDFVARCETLAGEQADRAMTALRTKYAAKLDAARLKITDAQIAAQGAQAEYDASFGMAATVTSALGSLLGGRRSRSSITSMARKEASASAKVGSSAAKADAAARAYAELEARLDEEIVALDEQWKSTAAAVEPKSVPLSRSDVAVTDFRLVWLPAS